MSFPAVSSVQREAELTKKRETPAANAVAFGKAGGMKEQKGGGNFFFSKRKDMKKKKTHEAGLSMPLRDGCLRRAA